VFERRHHNSVRAPMAPVRIASPQRRRRGYARPMRHWSWALAAVMGAAGCGTLFPGPDPVGEVDAANACAPLRVVFDGGGGSAQDVFIAGLDGSGRIAVAPSPAIDFGPVGSVDGFVALQSSRDGPFQIYVARADGSMVTRLAPTSLTMRYPAFSRAGNRLAFVRSGQLVDANRDGSDLVAIPSVDMSWPAWSPDDRELVALNLDLTTNDTRHLVVHRADGTGAMRQLTFGGDNQRAPTWSPDGARIAFENEAVLARHADDDHDHRG